MNNIVVRPSLVRYCNGQVVGFVEKGSNLPVGRAADQRAIVAKIRSFQSDAKHDPTFYALEHNLPHIPDSAAAGTAAHSSDRSLAGHSHTGADHNLRSTVVAADSRTSCLRALSAGVGTSLLQ